MIDPLPRIPPLGFVGLDFETFGLVDLPKYGLDRYMNDPSFQILLGSTNTGSNKSRTFDFVEDRNAASAAFRNDVNTIIESGYWFSAHNVGFERGCLQHLGFSDYVLARVTDSAVVARAQGAASSLEMSAAQLTDVQKIEAGRQLIMKFSVPTDDNKGRPYTWEELQGSLDLTADWETFIEYCEMDAHASRVITTSSQYTRSFLREHEMEWYTYLMNRHGWNLDMPLVNEMQLRFEENTRQLVSNFYALHGKNDDGTPAFTDKFLNSTPQMKEWCAARGIRTTSFDSEHIGKLLRKVQAALNKTTPLGNRYMDYRAVEDLLILKKELGGSSLTKLQKIKDLTGTDGRLRNQYMHLGAGQSYRSTGKGVQLQNLKRLSAEPMDFTEGYSPVEDADNTALAENLRQVFIADTPTSFQIVGDFSSVESRGLAWVAGADWKVEAFRAGKDLYKVQAEAIYGTPYDQVTKQQRQVGKVGELGCGYGAGPVALGRFAGKMGIEMSEEEAKDLVSSWRGTNPEVVELWEVLNQTLRTAVTTGQQHTVLLAHGLVLTFTPVDTPPTLQKQHPGATSIRMALYGDNGMDFVLERIFHGCYLRGNDVCFYKPSDLKTGDLWRGHYRDPQSEKTIFYKLYGGKLTGILVQSMCRELFFDAMQSLFQRLHNVPNATPIGQFHDELVVSWSPSKEASAVSFAAAKEIVTLAMSEPRESFDGFPLEADVKHDYRYTK